MANELIINASLPETRIALIEDGEIQELLVERASGKGIVGNIYKGRVTRVLPGMQAAFVDIGGPRAAFLYVDDVYVHPEHPKVPDEEEEPQPSPIITEIKNIEAAEQGEPSQQGVVSTEATTVVAQQDTTLTEDSSAEKENESAASALDLIENETEDSESDDSIDEDFDEDEDEDEQDDDDRGPAGMGPDPKDSDENSQSEESTQPSGTISPEQKAESEDKEVNVVSGKGETEAEGSEGGAEGEAGEGPSSEEDANQASGSSAQNKRRHRRGRRGGRFRRRTTEGTAAQPAASENYPENYHEQIADTGNLISDRSGVADEKAEAHEATERAEANRPETASQEPTPERRVLNASGSERTDNRAEFRAPRSRDRRIRAKQTNRPVRPQVNIQDLLKEGQEVLVQVAKDPIATKGARLTCHISLPGRHLVCMPTIDHVGVSRRIEREDERRRLREFVERNRPRNLGFIVRTASGRQQSEKRVKQDIDYLTRLWSEIKEKAATVTAPALVYEDLNAVLRSVRDWVTEEIDKVIVDSRYHYNEIQKFVSHFMPPLKQKVELYHGDIPIFDAYGISTELSRALERKVWLKSGGYIVIDQAEALVAIDVNTGRYVGKKNLEDTIFKTNLEAVQEIAYQLRLRNCGGIIILDLIDMEKDENKQRVYRALEEALSKDRARPTILKISELGLVEMTRKRTRDTIVRTLCEPCTHCEGKGFIKAKQTVAYEVMREVERVGIERDVNKILVQAHPDVIDILAVDERESLDQLERRYRKMIYLQAVNDFHPEQFEVTADKRERSERGHDNRPERGRNRERDRERERDRNRHQEPTPAIVPAVASNAAPAPTVVIKPVEPRPVVAAGTEAAAGDPAQEANVESLENGVSSETSSEDSKAGANSEKTVPKSQDEFFDEEDRLAFLRAQAAQDAALARLNSGNHAARGADHSSRDRTAANRRNPRGRRPSKFRRNDRGRDRSPKQMSYHPHGNRWIDPAKDPGFAESNSGNFDPQGNGGNDPSNNDQY